MIEAPLAVIARLAVVLDDLRITYVIGGSIASSLYGVPRATHDVDIVADLRNAHVDRLVTALAPEFYIDAEMIRSALQERSSFNVIHLDTMLKADIFVPVLSLWIVEELVRGRVETLDIGGQPTKLRFATPEDTLLYKLVWYRLGGEQSDRQWSDVLGIIDIQAERLDRNYLRHWSSHLGVEDLLGKALTSPRS
jgi:hypothetical protein